MRMLLILSSKTLLSVAAYAAGVNDTRHTGGAEGQPA